MATTRHLRAAQRRLGSLRRRPEVRAFERAARARGAAAWLVGGALRDLLLGRPVAEVDVAVAGDAEELASDLERDGAGRAVFLSRDRPGPRVYRVAGRHVLDIAELEGGSISADLGRRDFTVNAFALDLSTGGLVDPFGGLSDLARRRLRSVSDENLSEDPLRMLRAARFLATHGLRPEAELLTAARRRAPLIERVAVERIGAELSKLLGAARAAPALEWAARARILPAVLGRRATPSRAFALARSLEAFDDAAVRRLSSPRRRRLRLARLALALRLPAPAARSWLSERRWSRDESRDAAHLVELAASSRRTASARDAWAWILDADDLAEDALMLLDRLGAADRRRARNLRHRLARRRPRVAIRGQDVVDWLGIGAGPRVGELLRAARVAAAMGEVSNRREARNWLIGQVREGL
jgi:tRNA nucleotidyltransferase/poly(A) polymerase